MQPIKTRFTNKIFKLRGGTDENDLPVEQIIEEDKTATLASTWRLSDDERKLIAEGANIVLTVWGKGHPPVALTVVQMTETA